MKHNKVVINSEISSSRVFLVDADGQKLGEFLTQDAIQKADKAGLDLVAVGGSRELPVCKIMDYGKYIYNQKKKAKKNVSFKVKTKEVKIGFQSDPNIVGIRAEQAKKFLKEGHRVKLTVTFKGRERSHSKLIFDKCQNLYQKIEEFAQIDSHPKMTGCAVTMTLSPRHNSGSG